MNTYWMEVVDKSRPGQTRLRMVKAQNERGAYERLRVQGCYVIKVVSVDKDPTRKSKKGLLGRILSFFKKR